MSCTIYNPTLNREMDRLFDNLLERTGLIQGDRYASIPVCIWEEPDRYCIELDLPGVKKEDIQVSVQKGMLRITAERHSEEAENRKCFTRSSNARLRCRTPSIPKTSTRNSSTAF